MHGGHILILWVLIMKGGFIGAVKGCKDGSASEHAQRSVRVFLGITYEGAHQGCKEGSTSKHKQSAITISCGERSSID